MRMQKSISLLLALSFVTLLLARTPEQAAQIASTFMAQPHTIHHQLPAKHNLAPRSVELAYVQYQMDATSPAVYVFNDSDRQGFVLVSANDDARPVLGYADHGYVDPTNIPANMRFWMQMYADELAAFTPNQQDITSRHAGAAAAAYPSVEPIIQAQWGQDAPYNLYSPTVDGQKTPTGCVATAVTQIMHHYKHPARGQGSHTYTSETYGITLSADFGATTYDWDHMLTHYTRGAYTTQQAEAVATLLHHVGIACNMDYAPGGSGAVTRFAMQALVDYFDYDAAYRELSKNYFRQSYMLEQIAAELLAGRPLVVSGRTTNDEGHAFVCDGMQPDGFLHINWGWDGYCDGYYAISALAPESHGTGGSSSGLAFTEDVTIFIGIQPDQGNSSSPLLTVEQVTRHNANVISSPGDFYFEFTKLLNIGTGTANGHLVFDIYDIQDNLVSTLQCQQFELESHYYYQNYHIYTYDDVNLPDGEYMLMFALCDNEGQHYNIHQNGRGEVRIPFSVIRSQVVFPEQQLMPIENAELIHHAGTQQWDVDFSSLGFWYDQPSDCEMLLRCTLYSNSETSVVGTYRLDPTNSGQPGTIGGAIYAIGYHSECQQFSPDDLYLTITPSVNGQLLLQYYLRYDNDVIQDKFYLVTPEWYIKQDDQFYFYSSSITSDLAATLPAFSASAFASTLPLSEATHMHFYVDGIISKFHNTPLQIAQNKTATFSVSSDSQSDALLCSSMRWLNNTDFVTGDEIHTGDTLVLYGVLQHTSDQSGEMQGYVVRANCIDYAIYNLALTSQTSKSVSVQWESRATLFEFSVLDAQNTQLVHQYLTQNQATFAIHGDGIYTVHVQPVDADHYYLAPAATLTIQVANSVRNLQTLIQGNYVLASWDCTAPHFLVSAIGSSGDTVHCETIDHVQTIIHLNPGDYTIVVLPLDTYLQPLADATTVIVTVGDFAIHDLTVDVNEGVMTATWRSASPHFHLRVWNQGGDTIANYMVLSQQWECPLENDTYVLWLRPLDGAKGYYLSEAVEVVFTVETADTDAESVLMNDMLYLYDLMGRLVDTQSSASTRAWNVPATGVYILFSNGQASKILL